MSIHADPLFIATEVERRLERARGTHHGTGLETVPTLRTGLVRGLDLVLRAGWVRETRPAAPGRPRHP